MTALARHRRPAAGRRRERPDASRRRDRRRRRRQGGALHRPVRRVRAAAAVPLRHARLHGRPGRRAHGDRAPLRADVPRRRQSERAVAARSCCARATGWARRRWPAAASRRRCSRSRWPTSEFGGMGLEGAVRLGMRRELDAIDGRAGARARLRGDGRRRLRARPRPEHGGLRRDRRRDRPGRLAPLDRDAVRRARRRSGGSGRARRARTSTPGSAGGERGGAPFAQAHSAAGAARRAPAESACGVRPSRCIITEQAVTGLARAGPEADPHSTSFVAPVSARNWTEADEPTPPTAALRMRTVRAVDELRLALAPARRAGQNGSASCRRWARCTTATSR